jgi:hypothetical protein
MGLRGRHIILLAFVIVVVNIAYARVQPANRQAGPPASGPRVENGSFVIETRSGGPMYYATGMLRGPGASITDQRAVIPLKQIAGITLYEVRPVWQCDGQGLCNPCGPTRACLNPPKPLPPPLKESGGSLAGFMAPPAGPPKRQP